MPLPSPSLPVVLPVFPLTGSLLLPGNYLPLNVFEPRYRNMVADAMAGEQAIGMVQPRLPDPADNWGLDPDPPNPELYEVGCAGRIVRCEPQPDGRYHLVLEGVMRFRVGGELPLHRGYRRVQADYVEFAADPGEKSLEIESGALLSAVRAFSRVHGLELDFTLLGGLAGITLLNGLAAALPFCPAERQALLEAADPGGRLELLLMLLEMGVPQGAARERFVPPTIH